MPVADSIFAIPCPSLFPYASLAEVISVQDPEGLSRVQIRLLYYDGNDTQDGPVWARVAVPFAGADRGAFFIPDVGDEVLVTFLNGDPRFPIVLGGLWNGAQQPPESLPGDAVDRWTITGKNGTRIAIVEQSAGREQILLETPGGASVELTDAGGGKLEINCAGTTVTINSGGVTVSTPSKTTVQASTIEVKAITVKVDAAFSEFTGIVKTPILLADMVVSKAYTPGAGNIW
jgi:uncharacterized protein involved in type VI secretion and phage assembly